MIILLTGAAGFIGFHAAKRLLSEGHQVIGVDNLNDYYDVSLKEARLAELKKYESFEFHKVDISCLLYTSPSPRDATLSRMPSSA